MGEDKTVDKSQTVQPLISARSRGVSIALFPSKKNPNEKHIVIQKSYQKDGNWVRNSIFLFPNEAADLKTVVQQFLADLEIAYPNGL